MFGGRRHDKDKDQKKNPTATLDEMKKKFEGEIEELKKEAAIPREKTSVTADGLIKYVRDNAANDPFLLGSPPPNSPFIEKRRCTIL